VNVQSELSEQGIQSALLGIPGWRKICIYSNNPEKGQRGAAKDEECLNAFPDIRVANSCGQPAIPTSGQPAR